LKLLVAGVLTFFLFLPVIGLAARIRKALELPQILLFAIALLLLGVVAEATFFLTMVSTVATAIIVWFAAIAGTVFTLLRLRDRESRDEIANADSWAPFAAMGAAGFAFVAMLAISLPPLAVATNFAGGWLLSLPGDNILPHILTQHIAAHLPPKPFVGDWLSSDRPPLQSGFDLLLGILAPTLSNSDTRYQAMSMLLQASAMGMFFTLCRLLGCSGLRSGAVTLLASASGFVFLNTVFVWPKLLSAAFMLLAVALYLAPGELRRARGALMGVAVGLALLSHGGVVFTLPALLVAWFIRRGRAAIYPVAIALCAVLVINAPWTWYQKAYDPPGDRLLKWHLAGKVPVTTESFLPTFYHAYMDVPASTIVNNKVLNLETLFDVTLSELPPRARDFYYVADTMGVLIFPFLLALVFIRSKRRQLESAAQFGWIAVASLILWALLLYTPKGDVVHQGSYATNLLMLLAGGIVATEWLPLFVIFLAWQLFHFGTVWWTAVDFSNARTFNGIAAILTLTLIAGACCAVTIRPIIRRIRPSSSDSLGVTLTAVAFAVPICFGLIPIFAQPAHAVPIQSPAVAAALTTLPPMNSLTLRHGHAILSLDSISINGVPTVVASLTKQRTFHVRPTDSITFSGWAFDPQGFQPAGGLAIRLPQRTTPMTYGIQRPDVAATFKLPALSPVGFTGQLAPGSLRGGINHILLVVVSSDRKAYYLNPTLVNLTESK
jgi:hypothetical protein